MSQLFPASTNIFILGWAGQAAIYTEPTQKGSGRQHPITYEGSQRAKEPASLLCVGSSAGLGPPRPQCC